MFLGGQVWNQRLIERLKKKKTPINVLKFPKETSGLNVVCVGVAGDLDLYLEMPLRCDARHGLKEEIASTAHRITTKRIWTCDGYMNIEFKVTAGTGAIGASAVQER